MSTTSSLSHSSPTPHATHSLIDLHLGYEFLHGFLLFLHLILQDLNLRLEFDVLLSVRVRLYLQLNGVLIELLLLLDIVLIWLYLGDLDVVVVAADLRGQDVLEGLGYGLWLVLSGCTRLEY